MKKVHKELLGAVTLAAVGIGVLSTSTETTVERQILTPIGIPIERLEGTVLLEEIENALTLAKIQSRPVKVRALMGGAGATASDPQSFRVVAWDVALANGKQLRLEFEGAMNMLPGETIEEARERFARTKE